jgi:hypothetical protein
MPTAQGGQMRRAFISITQGSYDPGGYDACCNERSTWEYWHM